MVVIAKIYDEKINKKIITRTPTFLLWKNKARPPSRPPTITTTTITKTKTLLATVRKQQINRYSAIEDRCKL